MGGNIGGAGFVLLPLGGVGLTAYPRSPSSQQSCTHYTLGGPPHPVMVTIGDNRDHIRVLLYSDYTRVGGAS